MTLRRLRLAQFNTDRDPPPFVDCQVLCEDHIGTYLAPFLCRFAEGAWRNVTTGECVAAVVLGWAVPRSRAKGRKTAAPIQPQ